ncbi:MAG TPA: hypothetical protein G4O02_10700 [Caldilineae bacterium]|nr:hypothetical protein [Caldilineae bacterium]
MPRLEQSLIDHPSALLRAIAELRGVSLSARHPREMASELASALSEPAEVARALDDLSPEAMAALEALAAAGGHIQATVFQRQYGEIRPFGPGRLARERPWEKPTGPAEELWYRGWIFRGFVEIDGVMTEVIFIPDEILGLLPRKSTAGPELVAAPGPAQAIDHGDAIVQDVLTLVAMALVEGMRRRRGRWHTVDLAALVGRFIISEEPPLDPAGCSRLALILHLVEHLGWIHEEGGRAKVRAAAIRPWLEADRAAQWKTLWLTWRDDETWDDLRKIPELVCEGGWHDDPVGARRRLLAQLAQLPPGEWYALDDWVAAVKALAPDFLRPDGDYDSWYIRSADGGGYLRGFEHWEDVEGRLIRYFVRGPLHWFGLVALDPAGERFALTDAGRALAQGEEPPVTTSGEITVTRDFAVLVPTTVPCFDRLRVARFTMWEASPKPGSEEPFRYRITRRALRRARAQGITVDRVLAFLRDRVGDWLPENVIRALERV